MFAYKFLKSSPYNLRGIPAGAPFLAGIKNPRTALKRQSGDLEP